MGDKSPKKREEKKKKAEKVKTAQKASIPPVNKSAK